MHLFSASQVSKYDAERGGCARQWAFKYIGGLPDPSGPAAALGTEVDNEQLQPYLRDGRPFDYSRPSESGYIAAAGLAYLPAPKSHGLEVQKHFVMPSPTPGAGFGFQGYIDLWLPKGGMPDIAGYLPVVADFKTTGNWKYAKTVEGLKTDVQAQLYATWAMYSTGARVVDLVWLYFATKGPRKSKRVHLRVQAEHVVSEFLKVNDTATEMYRVLKSGAQPLDLEPNPDACESYGGCPYRHHCNLSPGQIIDSKAALARARRDSTITMNAPATVSLLAGLKAKKAGLPAPAASTPAPAPAPTTASTAAPASTPIVPYYQQAPTTAAGIPVENIPARFQTPAATPAPFAGINPPESTLPPPPPAPAPAPVAAAAAPAPALEVVAKRGPGRPRKAAAPVTDPKPQLESQVAPSIPPATTITHPEVERASASADAFGFETVTAVWGREKFSPVAYNDFDIGPFEAVGFVRAGESIADATARIYTELAGFAQAARAAKAESYRNFLASIGGAR